MELKQLVNTIESLNGVSVHLPGDGILSLGNNSGFNARIREKDITYLEKIKSPKGEPCIQINFIEGRVLYITSNDFAFLVSQNGMFKIKDFVPVISIKELIRDLSTFKEVVRNPNLDAIEAQFFMRYYALQSAVYFGFNLDREIAKLYDQAKDLHFFIREDFPLFQTVYLGNRGLKLQKLKVEDCYGILDFINYWKNFYAYGKEDKYVPIHQGKLSYDDLLKLFEWKNGMNLSIAKQNSFDTKIASKLAIINSLKSDKKFDLNYFLNEFNNVSVVWKVFLLHVIKPNIYPIYDQHIHRAYEFITYGDFSNITSNLSEKIKLNFYLQEYLPFVRRMEIQNLKEMDEAFFAFGQFLNINNQKTFF